MLWENLSGQSREAAWVEEPQDFSLCLPKRVASGKGEGRGTLPVKNVQTWSLAGAVWRQTPRAEEGGPSCRELRPRGIGGNGSFWSLLRLIRSPPVC